MEFRWKVDLVSTRIPSVATKCNILVIALKVLFCLTLVVCVPNSRLINHLSPLWHILRLPTVLTLASILMTFNLNHGAKA